MAHRRDIQLALIGCRMDKLTPRRRSDNMRQIRSKDTSPELAVRRLIFAMGFRYRLHSKDLPGKPDLVFRGKRKVIFVHGCFWHCHQACREGRIPATRQDYWRDKLAKNTARDSEHQRKLVGMGWSCLIVWECELRDMQKLASIISAYLSTSSAR